MSSNKKVVTAYCIASVTQEHCTWDGSTDEVYSVKSIYKTEAEAKMALEFMNLTFLNDGRWMGIHKIIEQEVVQCGEQQYMCIEDACKTFHKAPSQCDIDSMEQSNEQKAKKRALDKLTDSEKKLLKLV